MSKVELRYNKELKMDFVCMENEAFVSLLEGHSKTFQDRKVTTMITQQKLQDLFNYDKDTGIFTWKVAKAKRIKIGDIAGCLDTQGYHVLKIDGKRYKAHRMAYLYSYGVMPAFQIDHINNIRNDNRLCNLRAVTHEENQRNRLMSKNNKSGYNGVYFEKGKCLDRYRATIRHHGKSISLGSFRTFEEAVNARKEAEMKYWEST